MENNKQTAQNDTAGALVEWLKPAMITALPKHLSADRMVRIVLTEMRKTPDLMKCTKQSLAGAVIMASQLGLEPGVNGQCWLIPYKKEATFIIGYQGLIELAYRSNKLECISGEAVYEHDEFSYSLGTSQTINHTPAEGDRGKLTHAYAVAFLKGGTKPIFKVLTKSEIMKVKASSQSAQSQYSPWKNWEAEMWVKTAIKKLMKFVPKSAEMAKALDTDNRVEAGGSQPFSGTLDLPQEQIEDKSIDVNDLKDATEKSESSEKTT